MKHIGFIFTIIILFVSCEKEKISATDYLPNTNLFLPDAHGDSAAVADPHVIKVGNTWYLYGTHSFVNMEVWYSTDLENWKYGGVILQPQHGKWNDHDVWAPHVEQAPDGYYMYYSASGKIGVAFSTSPLGPFTDIYNHPFVGNGYGGVATNTFLEGAIDAFVLKASDGKLYFYFCYSFFPIATIKAIPMIDYKTLENTVPVSVLDVQLSDVLSWEFTVREGPWVIEHNGIFNLIYSGNNFAFDAYAIGIATSTNPLGPFQRKANNPFFSTNQNYKLFGPGHHSIVEGKHNDLLMFFHTRNNPNSFQPRKTRYIPIYFDANGNIQIKLD